jgi:hypothetical protein
MLLSALLPGLGQIYVGGTRAYAVGGAMAAVDLLSAWQYFDNDKKGDDRKSDYEALARDHYKRDRFDIYVKDTLATESGWWEFTPCNHPGDPDSSAVCDDRVDRVFPLSPNDDAAFYEQIGDEDRYIFGWDDWDPYHDAQGDTIENHERAWLDWNPYDRLPEGISDRSALRGTYRAFKREADDFYGKADRYAWVMVIGRVVSMVDAAILVKLRNRDLALLGGNPRLTVKANFSGNPDFKVGLKMRF